MSLHSDPPAHPPSHGVAIQDKESRVEAPIVELVVSTDNDETENRAIEAQRKPLEQGIYKHDEHVEESSSAGDNVEQEERVEPPPPPPDFAPFYTLITDPVTGSHTHPTVHYIFADDDPDIVTSALLSSVKEERTSSGNDRLSAETNLKIPPTSEAPIERFVILDMSDDGKRVTSASSLAPDWQALTTSITPAPSWKGGDEDDEEGTQKGLMLRISGQEDVTKERDRRLRGDLDALMQAFDQGLADLAGVVDL